MRRLFLFLIALGWLACGGSARDALGDARGALAEARYDDAIVAAETGLSGQPDEVTAWGLELVRLEAMARGGRGDDAVALIARLAEERPQQIGASQYSASAGQLQAADQGVAAIQMLDLGLQRFPDDPALKDLIEQAKAAPEAGSDELEMLRSLGYLAD